MPPPGHDYHLSEIERLQAQIAYQSQRIGDLEAGLRDLRAHHEFWAETTVKPEQRFYHNQQARQIGKILGDDKC